ncbi:MAG: hypothetical protein ALECFALPRED_007939 [Alectoria fallacina]|uniref:Uncharacterized protein n=1 Tax=Alectoria fallacina TaxID=1903189 RepID=A0A8H3PE83_9LECA|nr:MAG: hypothetical protein ALECFALPRED_007939 [Alectoria fallacina]
MCLYNIFSFECGCESQPPTFHCLCPPFRAGRRGVYPEFDHHYGGPPQGCRFFIVNRETITPGKCASHRLQAQIENRIRQLKEEIKHLQDDIADHRVDINQEKEARRARNQGRQGQYRVLGGYGGRGVGRH